MSVTYTEGVIELMASLPEEKQRQVVDYARSLRSEGKSLSGEEIAKRLAGLFLKEDLEEIERAIEVGREGDKGR